MKKIVIKIACILFAVMSFNTSACAKKSIDLSNIKLSILMSETIECSSDLNYDGVINVFDMIRLSQAYLYNQDSNPLYGKKISVNGDSICYGVGYEGGYAKIIGENNNMFVQNLAVGGATISSETLYKDGRKRYYICENVDKMDSNSDYFILEGGVNDAGLSVELGTLTDGYNSELDTTTYIGALEYCCKQLINLYHGKKYGFIIVHQMVKGYRPDEDYYEYTKKVCRKWGVPYLDLNTSVPAFNYFNDGDELAYLREMYTYNGDGWHPNEACYIKYYVPKIEAWLKTL